MKNLLIIILSFSFVSTNATIRRVNKNPGVIPVAGLVYTSFDSAIAEANPDDTLYIEPSHLDYGTPTLTKRVTIIGNGFEIAKNLALMNPLPYNLNESIFTHITFNPGSENAQIIGLRFINQVTISAAGVKISRCLLLGSVQLNASQILIDQCFFLGSQATIAGTGTNSIVKNTIIGKNIQSVNNVLFDHCYINDLNSSFVTNCIFTNCIINTIAANYPLNNTFSFCIKIGTGTTFPSPGVNNNQEGIPMENIFVVSNPMAPTLINEKDFRLKNGSPALGSGTGGVDIGPFGGSSPYRLSAQAPIPVITNFYLNTTGSTASGLTGSITIQSNN